MSKLLTGVRAVQFTNQTFVGKTPLKKLIQKVLIFLRERPKKVFFKGNFLPWDGSTKESLRHKSFPLGRNSLPRRFLVCAADPRHHLSFVILIFIYFFLFSDEGFFSQIGWPNCCWSCFSTDFQLCLDRDEACDNSSKAEMFALTYEIRQNWRSFINPYLQSCFNMPVLWWMVRHCELCHMESTSIVIWKPEL